MVSLRRLLRAAGWLISELIPAQAIRSRDINAAAEQLADAEAEYEVLDAPEPPVEVELDSPPAPSTGLSDWRLAQHARRWCDLPILRPGPLPTPQGHPDHQ